MKEPIPRDRSGKDCPTNIAKSMIEGKIKTYSTDREGKANAICDRLRDRYYRGKRQQNDLGLRFTVIFKGRR